MQIISGSRDPGIDIATLENRTHSLAVSDLLGRIQDHSIEDDVLADQILARLMHNFDSHLEAEKFDENGKKLSNLLRIDLGFEADMILVDGALIAEVGKLKTTNILRK